jgi:hypothetical protein
MLWDPTRSYRPQRKYFQSYFEKTNPSPNFYHTERRNDQKSGQFSSMCLFSCWYITKLWDETEDHSQNWEFLTKAILQQSPIPWFDHSKKESSEIWVILINVPSYLHHQHQAPRCTWRGYFATVFKSRFYHKTEVPKEWTWCQTGLQLTSAQLSEALVRESDMVIDVERFQGSMMTWWRVLCIGAMFWECGQWLWWPVSQRKFSLPKCPICLRKLTVL